MNWMNVLEEQLMSTIEPKKVSYFTDMGPA
jgi:hypothetical protein